MAGKPVTDYSGVTFTISLPRSRTAWLCWFFGHAMTTMHDPLKDCASIDELGEKIDAKLQASPRLFITDTAAVFFVDQLVARFPGAQYLVVTRDPYQVRESLRRKGVFSLRLSLRQENAFRWASATTLAQQKTYRVSYDSLNHPVGFLHSVWEFVVGEKAWESIPHGYDTWGAFAREACAHHVDIPMHVQARGIHRGKVQQLFRGIIDIPN
jgi:hypothetical protein